MRGHTAGIQTGSCPASDVLPSCSLVSRNVADLAYGQPMIILFCAVIAVFTAANGVHLLRQTQCVMPLRRSTPDAHFRPFKVLAAFCSQTFPPTSSSPASPAASEDAKLESEGFGCSRRARPSSSLDSPSSLLVRIEEVLIL